MESKIEMSSKFAMLFGVVGFLLLLPLTSGSDCDQSADPCATNNDAVVNDLVELLGMLKLKVNVLQSTVDELKCCCDKKTSAAGVSYVRWGRKSCPANETDLYSGYMAGPHHNLNGGGSNFLCLPTDPQWKSRTNGEQAVMGKLYGVEYELLNVNLFSNANNGGNPILNQLASCAVCYTPARSTQIMIPARTECPTGWTKEYEGYLVAEANYQTRHRNSYVCVDEAPEVAAGGGVNQDQSVFYHVEVGCGSLPCSNYTTGWELACVVCTK